MWRLLSKTKVRVACGAVGMLALLALSGTVSSSAADGSAGAGLGDAAPVLERYFEALKSGDVGALSAVLGGDLLARRRPLLDNPIYPGELVAAYGNAQFKVMNWSWKRSKAISVDVAVLLDQNESIKWRLTVERDSLAKAGMLIIDTTTIAE
jgi:hypothetical protein